MRAIIREIIARRQPHPPEEFIAIQVSRLNEALLVAFSAMSPSNLKAVDRVVRIVGELDRRHGFSATAGLRLPETSPGLRGFEAAKGTAAYGGALFCRAEFEPGLDLALDDRPIARKTAGKPMKRWNPRPESTRAARAFVPASC